MDTSNNNNKQKLIKSETTNRCNDITISANQSSDNNVMIGHYGKLECQDGITEHVENKDTSLSSQQLSDNCKQELLDQVEYLQKQNCDMTDWINDITKTLQQLEMNCYLAKHEVDKTFETIHKLFSDKKDEICKEIDDQFKLKHCELEKQKMELENIIKTTKSTCQEVHSKLDDMSSSHGVNDSDSGVACEETFTISSEINQNGETYYDHKDNLSEFKNEELHNLFYQKNKQRLCNLQKFGSTELIENSAVDIKLFGNAKSYLEHKYKSPCENEHLVWKPSSKINEALQAIKLKDFGKVLCSRVVAHQSIIKGDILQDIQHHCVINCDYHVTLTTRKYNGDIDIVDADVINANITRVRHENYITADNRSSFEERNRNATDFSNTFEPDVLSTSLSLDNIADQTRNTFLTSTPIKACSSEILLTENEPILCKIKKTKTGVFDISFQINRIGNYSLNVKLFGEHVINSPCRINAITKKGTKKSVPRIDSKEIAKKQKTLRKRISDSNFEKHPIDIDRLFRLGSRGRSLGEFSNPQDIAISNDGRFYVTDSNNQCVQVFEISYSQAVEVNSIFRFGERGRSVGQILRPTGVAMLNPDRVAVSDYENKIVNLYTKEGKFCNRIGAGKLLGPRGISIDNNGNIIVVDNKHCKVFTFQPNGKLIRSFGSRGVGESQLAGPHYAAVNQNGDIFVTDFYNHCVKVFTSRGVYIRSIGSHGEDIGEFNAPTGISIDSKGHVIVADWGNSRLQVFDQCGLFIGFIKNKDEQLYGPQGVSTTSDGYVAVADTGNQCVKVYRIKQ